MDQTAGQVEHVSSDEFLDQALKSFDQLDIALSAPRDTSSRRDEKTLGQFSHSFLGDTIF